MPADTVKATADENFAMDVQGGDPSAAAPFPGGGDKGRFNAWAFLALFSLLTLVAHSTDDQNLGRGTDAWITTCATLSLIVSLVLTVAHTGRVAAVGGVCVDTLVEGVAALVLVGLWAGALPVIMDPGKGLAQMYVGKNSDASESSDYQAVISNANLFFAGWAAGVSALTVLAKYVTARLGAAAGVGAGYATQWYFLMLASVIIVIESLRFQKQVCGIEGGTEAQTCARNTYGLITGILGLVVSFLVSLAASLGKESALLTTVASFLLACLYTICAGLVTFENGPATYVGNHYFSAWAGFFVSFAVFGTVLKEFLGVGAGGCGGGGAAADVV